MRFLILGIVLILFDIYAFQAIKYTTSSIYLPIKWSIFIVYWLITVAGIIYFYMLGSRRITREYSHFMTLARSFLIILALSKFVLVIGVSIDDIRRFFTILINAFSPLDLSTTRSVYLLNTFNLFSIIPLVLLTYGMIRNPYRYRIFHKHIFNSKWPQTLDGLRIVQISDIHAGSFGKHSPIDRAVKMINNLKPDLVFFTGDLVNNQASELTPFISVFKMIEAKYGVYSILGNHDYGDYISWPNYASKEANLQQLVGYHNELGWKLLKNAHDIIQVGDESIAIIGVENYSVNDRFTKYGNLTKAYQGTEEINLKLLLSHDPSHWRHEVTEKFKDIFITFSGHTHGMQFGIEISDVFKWSPIKYVYKEWAGLYHLGNQYLYVNRGFGFLGYPGRVGILPEITCLDLYNKKNDN